MGNANLSETCYACRGTGTAAGDQGNGAMDCPVCEGSGLRKYGEIPGFDPSDILDKLNDIKEKVDEL